MEDNNKSYFGGIKFGLKSCLQVLVSPSVSILQRRLPSSIRRTERPRSMFRRAIADAL